jgi:DNA-binding transcriptional ArsR family regulator
MVDYNSERLDLIFKALSDKTRRAMLRQLAQKESSVTELAEPHAMSLAAVSKHLKVLESAQFIERTKDGRISRCRANLAPLSEISALLEDLGSFWRVRLDSLAALLEDSPIKGDTNEDRKYK